MQKGHQIIKASSKPQARTDQQQHFIKRVRKI